MDIPHLISCRYGATVCVLDDLLDLVELSRSCRISAKEFSRERVRELGKKCPHFVGRRRAVLSALEDVEGDFVRIRSHYRLLPGLRDDLDGRVTVDCDRAVDGAAGSIRRIRHDGL